MTNPFNRRANSLSGPGIDYVPVTPDDATDLTDVAASIYVEGAGAVSFVSVKGQARTVNVSDFGWIICGATRILATGTTATGIHAVVVS
ncbi:spike base protein, RCAP_Rcc01079 family [Halovulum sp. GXIMD14793]